MWKLKSGEVRCPCGRIHMMTPGDLTCPCGVILHLSDDGQTRGTAPDGYDGFERIRGGSIRRKMVFGINDAPANWEWIEP